MSAQRTDFEAEVNESDMLDAETSAALLRWMETSEVPDGIDRARWERWAGGGCREPIDARGVAVHAGDARKLGAHGNASVSIQVVAH